MYKRKAENDIPLSEEDDILLSEEEVEQIMIKQRLKLLQNPNLRPKNPPLFREVRLLSAIDWFQEFESTLKFCGFSEDLYGKILLECLRPHHIEHLESLNLAEASYEVYKKALIEDCYCSRELLWSYSASSSPGPYLDQLKVICGGFVLDGERLKWVVEDCFKNNLIFHTDIKTLQELIKDIEYSNWYDYFASTGIYKYDSLNTQICKKGMQYGRRKDICKPKGKLTLGCVSEEVLILVPTEIWQWMFPEDHYRRKTYLSLLQTCSSLRNHLLPLFEMGSPTQFRGLFEGYYSEILSSDTILKLEGNQYVSVVKYEDRCVEYEGNWTLIKKDISNDYYALEVQLTELKQRIKRFCLRKWEADSLRINCNWFSIRKPMLIFSRKDPQTPPDYLEEYRFITQVIWEQMRADYLTVK